VATHDDLLVVASRAAGTPEDLPGEILVYRREAGGSFVLVDSVAFGSRGPRGGSLLHARAGELPAVGVPRAALRAHYGWVWWGLDVLCV
ncbi:MAG: hypothetical protein JRH20_30775, partial [Deltaproteobacteria bacterium]|nr:hypothetical protein [Deltaproteobacteria bacterium]